MPRDRQQTRRGRITEKNQKSQMQYREGEFQKKKKRNSSSLFPQLSYQCIIGYLDKPHPSYYRLYLSSVLLLSTQLAQQQLFFEALLFIPPCLKPRFAFTHTQRRRQTHTRTLPVYGATSYIYQNIQLCMLLSVCICLSVRPSFSSSSSSHVCSTRLSVFAMLCQQQKKQVCPSCPCGLSSPACSHICLAGLSSMPELELKVWGQQQQDRH